jgi:hypothetical protein
VVVYWSLVGDGYASKNGAQLAGSGTSHGADRMCLLLVLDKDENNNCLKGKSHAVHCGAHQGHQRPYAFMGHGYSCSAQIHRNAAGMPWPSGFGRNARQHPLAKLSTLAAAAAAAAAGDHSFNVSTIDENNVPVVPVMCGYTYPGKYARSFVSTDDPAEAVQQGVLATAAGGVHRSPTTA